MARILFGTNYSMMAMREGVNVGAFPKHHLWGVDELERAGHEVHYLDHKPDPRARLGHAWPARLRFGSPMAQLAGVRGRKTFDVIYGADALTFELLARLRCRRLWHTPLVATVHPNVDPRPWFQPLYRGYDVTLSFSRLIQRQLIDDIGRDSARTLLAPWGPDLDWPEYKSAGEDVIVCTGKTLRDYATVTTAVAGLGLGLRIHVPSSVPATNSPDHHMVQDAGYASVRADLARARIVIIPLLPPRGTVGITELNEAMAMGKAVVMTRNPYIDVDIDEIGCGISVAPGDAVALRAAVLALSDSPQLARDMGRRGRAYVERTWNARNFGRELVNAVDLALDGRP